MPKELYRGMRADNGQWVQSGCILRLGLPFCDDVEVYLAEIKDEMEILQDEDNNITEIPFCKFYLIDERTLCRSTGQHDKNGRLLYDWDIVLMDAAPEPMIIRWSAEMSKFLISTVDGIVYGDFEDYDGLDMVWFCIDERGMRGELGE